MLTMFLSRFQCTLSYIFTLDAPIVYTVHDATIILEDGYHDVFSPYVWDLLLINDLVQCFLQKIHSSSSQTVPIAHVS